MAPPSGDRKPGEAPPEYLIRGLTVADATGLGQVRVTVWRETYAELMSANALERLDPVRSAQQWAHIAEAAAGSNADGVAGPRTMIAEHRPSGSLVGFATDGPARDDDPPTPNQLWALNVLAAHHGTGVAAQLLAATIGDRAGYLWVVRGNARARAFYRRHGFVEDGTTLHDDYLDADEVRMIRR